MDRSTGGGGSIEGRLVDRRKQNRGYSLELAIDEMRIQARHTTWIFQFSGLSVKKQATGLLTGA